MVRKWRIFNRASVRTVRTVLIITLLCLIILTVQAKVSSFWLKSENPPASKYRTQDLISSPTGRFILGDYGSPLLGAANGSSVRHIDAEATINALKSAHINTYAYLICPDASGDPRVTRSQWDQLPKFARLAQAADIDIFVYLVPPTEAPEQAYAPFHWDYIAWFDEIGRIADREPSIKGIIIDDFGGNTITRPSLEFHFTVSYVARMTAAANRWVPTLSFLPVLYHHDLIGKHSVLSDYRRHIQAVIFPYFGYSDGRTVRGNTRDATKALTQGIEISGLLNCPKNEICRQVVLPARTGLDRTPDTAAWASEVSPVAGEDVIISFNINDDGGTAAKDNYQVQMVVDGTIVGTVNRGIGWKQRVFDITAHTSYGSSSALQIRVVRPLGVPRTRITIQMGSVSVRGTATDGGFAKPAQTSLDVTESPVANIPLIFMPYAKPLTAERGVGASAAYFASVLDQIDVLRTQGRIVGSLVFNVSLEDQGPGQPNEHYQVLARTYWQWSRR